MSHAVQSRFTSLEKLVVAAQDRKLDPEVASYYCKLGCVMICGTVEPCIEILVIERVGARSAPQVVPFLKSYFKRGTNYDCDAILELLFKFDGKWGHALHEFLNCNEKIKSDMSSCYAVRNSIAHGGGGSFGPKYLKQYFDNAFTLIAEVEKILRI